MSEVVESSRALGSARERFANRRHAAARDVIQLAAQALGTKPRLMPLRGVLLSAAGLVEPASRPLHDVDLLLDGISLAAGVACLARADFRIERGRRSHEGTIALSHPMHEALWLDLHRAPLPAWFGRVTSAYLFAESRLNTSLFGVPVYVPSHSRLVVHLIGHILKEGVIGAYRHAAADLAAATAVCTTDDFQQVAEHLRHLSLLEGGILAVLWAQGLTGSTTLEALAQHLEPEAQLRSERWDEVMSLKDEDRQTRALRPRFFRRIIRGFTVSGWSLSEAWIALRWRLASPVRS